MYQPSPGLSDAGDDIHIDGENLAMVSRFKYLGTTDTNDNKLDTELEICMSNASKAFGRLRDHIWDNKDPTIKTKSAVYRAIVLSVLLYGVESWFVYKVTAYKLNAFMIRHLRHILNIKWWQFISNERILKTTSLTGMYDILISRCLSRTGHFNRLDNTRIPKLILYSQLTDGTYGI